MPSVGAGNIIPTPGQAQITKQATASPTSTANLSATQQALLKQQAEMKALQEQASVKAAEGQRIGLEQAKNVEVYKRATLVQHVAKEQFKPLQRSAIGKIQEQNKQIASINEQLYSIGNVGSAKVKEYNLNVDTFNKAAQDAVAGLSTTPRASDIVKAQDLYNQGIISASDFANYKSVANQNEALFNQQAQAQKIVHAMTTIAVPSKVGTNLYQPSVQAPIVDTGRHYVLVTGNFQARDNPDSKISGNWRQDYTWVQAGWRVEGASASDRNAVFASVPGLPDAKDFAAQVGKREVMLSTDKAYQAQQIQVALGQQQVINARDVQLTNLEAAAKAKSEALKLNFGGVVNKEMLAPVGTITDIGKAQKAGIISAQDVAKAKMLSSGTAEFASQKDFEKAVAEVSPILSIQAKGVVVNPIFKSGADQIKAMVITNKVNNGQALTAEEQKFGLDNKIITEVKAPVKYPTIEGAKAGLTPSQMQLDISGLPAGSVKTFEQVKADKMWEGLSLPEKAVTALGASLVDFNVAANYVQNKIEKTGIKLPTVKGTPLEFPAALITGDFKPSEGISLIGASIGKDKDKKDYVIVPEAKQEYSLASDVYKTLKVEERTKAKETTTEAIKSGLYAGATSEAMQLAVSTAALGGAIGLTARGAAALGVGEGAITIGESLLGKGFMTAAGAEAVANIAQGKPGKAIVEGGAFAGSLPFAQAGYAGAVGLKLPSAPKVKLPSVFARTPAKPTDFSYLPKSEQEEILRSEVVASIKKQPSMLEVFSRSPPKTPEYRYLTEAQRADVLRTDVVKSIRGKVAPSAFSKSIPEFSYLSKASQEAILREELIKGIKKAKAPELFSKSPTSTSYLPKAKQADLLKAEVTKAIKKEAPKVVRSPTESEAYKYLSKADKTAISKYETLKSVNVKVPKDVVSAANKANKRLSEIEKKIGGASSLERMLSSEAATYQATAPLETVARAPKEIERIVERQRAKTQSDYLEEYRKAQEKTEVSPEVALGEKLKLGGMYFPSTKASPTRMEKITVGGGELFDFAPVKAGEGIFAIQTPKSGEGGRTRPGLMEFTSTISIPKEAETPITIPGQVPIERELERTDVVSLQTQKLKEMQIEIPKEYDLLSLKEPPKEKEKKVEIKPPSLSATDLVPKKEKTRATRLEHGAREYGIVDPATLIKQAQAFFGTAKNSPARKNVLKLDMGNQKQQRQPQRHKGSKKSNRISDGMGGYIEF